MTSKPLTLAVPALLTLSTLALVAQPTTDQGKSQTQTSASPELTLPSYHDLPVLPMEVNGVKGCMVVDTGAMSTAICDAVIDILKLKLQPSQMQIEGMGGRSQQTMEAKITARVIGREPSEFPGLSASHVCMPVAIEGIVPGVGPSFGLLGMPELAAAGAVVDCGKSRMLLHPKGDFKGPEGWHRLVMSGWEIKDQGPWLVTVRTGDKQSKMLVDTAASNTILSDAFAKLAGISLKRGTTSMSGVGSSAETMSEGVLQDLRLGDRVSLGQIPVLGTDNAALQEDVLLPSGAKVPLAGILGIDQLHRMGAIIDCKQGVMYVSPNPLPAIEPEPEPPDYKLTMQAITLLAEGGDQAAKDVLEAAQKSGQGLGITPKEGHRFLARAREKGILEKLEQQAKEEASECRDPNLLLKALKLLSENGDKEATDTLEAIKTNGRITTTPKQNGSIVARAKEKGLL